ncbi:MAG: LytTR family DNA-binding domain-containing protein, partial [Bacteroidota bacterium]
GIGLVGTEGQLLANYLLFADSTYVPGQAGGIYLFNGILSVVLGVMTLRWFRADASPTPPEAVPPAEGLTKIPLRKGDKTILVAPADVLYFEAYDNYAFLHGVDGTRSICNYSLGTLEEKLDVPFLRVHRKYLVNTDHITSITPHLKGRYVLTLGTVKPQSIRTSASYGERVRKLMKL